MCTCIQCTYVRTYCEYIMHIYKYLCPHSMSTILVSTFSICHLLFFQRYYYYIHNGIDTSHVAPLEDSWLEHVLSRVPRKHKVGTGTYRCMYVCTFIHTYIHISGFEMCRDGYQIDLYMCTYNIIMSLW